jgi:hypothetical protein
MENKKVLQKNSVNKIKPGVNPIDKKDARNIIPEKDAEKKQKKPLKKSSGFVASAVGRSAVDAVKARSSRDVRGSSDLANTGTIISYD